MSDSTTSTPAVGVVDRIVLFWSRPAASFSLCSMDVMEVTMSAMGLRVGGTSRTNFGTWMYRPLTLVWRTCQMAAHRASKVSGEFFGTSRST